MIKKCLFLSFVSFSILSGSGTTSVIPDRLPCLMELETHFFDSKLVYQALSLYQIPQGLWSPIDQSLQTRSRDIPHLMKQKTAFMVPNPIEYPLQKEATAKILKQILFDVFLQALRDNQIMERPTVDFIFDYIFLQQMPLFEKCLGPQPKLDFAHLLDTSSKSVFLQRNKFFGRGEKPLPSKFITLQFASLSNLYPKNMPSRAKPQFN